MVLGGVGTETAEGDANGSHHGHAENGGGGQRLGRRGEVALLDRRDEHIVGHPADDVRRGDRGQRVGDRAGGANGKLAARPTELTPDERQTLTSLDPAGSRLLRHRGHHSRLGVATATHPRKFGVGPTPLRVRASPANLGRGLRR